VSQSINGPMLEYINQAWANGVDILVVTDNVAVHFKAATKDLQALYPIPEKSHPPSLLVLNPIENVWGIMKHRLQALKRKPTSQDRLLEVPQELWDGIEQETIDKCIDSMVAWQEEF
jgi:hypothetical protein